MLVWQQTCDCSAQSSSSSAVCGVLTGQESTRELREQKSNEEIQRCVKKEWEKKLNEQELQTSEEKKKDI